MPVIQPVHPSTPAAPPGGNPGKSCSPSKIKSGRRFHGHRKPKLLYPFYEIAQELIFVDLLQIIPAELVVAAAGLQHGVGDDEHGMCHGHYRPFYSAARRQSPELRR